MPDVGIGVSIDMDPSAAILATELDLLGVDIRSFREPLKRAVQKVMGPSIGKNFELGGRPPWPELTEETVTHCAYFGTGILQRTGNLKRVAQQLNIWAISQDEAKVVHLPGAEYGWAHEQGATGGRGSQIPQRSFLMFQDEDVDAIEEVFADWFGERLERHGFKRGII